MFSTSTVRPVSYWSLKDTIVILSRILIIFNLLYSREKALLTLHVVTEMHFLLQKNLKNIMHGRVKMYAMR